MGWPQNGLSTWDTPKAACVASPNSKNYTKLDRLKLAVVPQLIVVAHTALPGHFFLAGATQARHDEWAATRDNAEVAPDPLTRAVLATSVGVPLPCAIAT